jgi:hypothetical protein
MSMSIDMLYLILCTIQTRLSTGCSFVLAGIISSLLIHEEGLFRQA